MVSVIIIIIIMIIFTINSVISRNDNITKPVNQLNINLEYGDNDTIILLYNLTTNYSYFITFRSFGDKQLKFGLFMATYKSEEYSIEIVESYDTKELFHLFIICFHFLIKKSNDLDIQCEDIKLLKEDQIQSNSSKEFLPSYNPLFVPMMYALSVLMLLPIMIQHHRRKTALVKQRRKQLRRLSITIAQDDQNPQQNLAKKILTHIVENGDVNYGQIPTDIELLPMSSTKQSLDDMDDNITFTLQNLPPFVHIYNENYIDDDEIGVNADDCVAHLLDNTPWNSPDTDQPILTSSSSHPSVHDRARALKEQHVPTIISFQDDDNDDDRKPILKSTKYFKVNFQRTNRAFFESDV